MSTHRRVAARTAAGRLALVLGLLACVQAAAQNLPARRSFDSDPRMEAERPPARTGADTRVATEPAGALPSARTDPRAVTSRVLPTGTVRGVTRDTATASRSRRLYDDDALDDAPLRRGWIVTVRMDDGTELRHRVAREPWDLRPGDRVRLLDGRLVAEAPLVGSRPRPGPGRDTFEDENRAKVEAAANAARAPRAPELPAMR